MSNHSQPEDLKFLNGVPSARPLPSLRSDAPITSSNQDQLNRTSLAKALARAIINVDAKESLVIGIYGGWGTGKTSLLNLLQEQLEAESKLPPLIMRFNPWDFSSQEQLTSQFFHELSVFFRLHKTIPTLSRVADIVDQYGILLSPVARLLSPHAAEVTKLAWSLFKKAGPKSIRTTIDLKAEINSVLTTLETKLVLLVDDIDRLNAQEIRQTFQLIKLNANFSNTVYVTAFKKEAVEKALSDVSPGPPGEYLEKIVQVAFPLPAIGDAKLSEFILNNFNDTLKSFPVQELDQQRFGNMFHTGFRRYFQTLRNVTRYFNSFRFALAMIGEDSNFIDLAAVQVLALFEPELYLAIEASSDVFVEDERTAFTAKEDIQKKFNLIFDSVNLKDREAAKDLCGFLFPKFGGRNRVFGSDWERQWEKEKRVCSSRYFPFYFQLAVPEGEVSNAEMARALQECTSAERFVQELERYNSSGRFSAFIDELRHRLVGLDKTKLLFILESIFIYGDKVGLEGTGFLRFISDHLRFSSWLLLDILDLLGEERYDHLINAMSGKEAVYTVVSVTTFFEQAITKQADDLRLREKLPNLTEEIVKRLKASALNVIESTAGRHELENAPNLPAILYRWKEWGNKEAVNSYVESTFLKDSKSAVFFVSRFVHKTQSIGMGDSVARVKKRVVLKNLAEFADLQKLAELVSNSIDSELSFEEQEAAQLFRTGMTRLDSGESLDSIDNPLHFD